MGMEPCWCNRKVTTKPVDVLDKSYIHFQRPLPGRFLSMPGIDAGTPARQEAQDLLKWKHNAAHQERPSTLPGSLLSFSPLFSSRAVLLQKFQFESKH